MISEFRQNVKCVELYKNWCISTHHIKHRLFHESLTIAIDKQKDVKSHSCSILSKKKVILVVSCIVWLFCNISPSVHRVDCSFFIYKAIEKSIPTTPPKKLKIISLSPIGYIWNPHKKPQEPHGLYHLSLMLSPNILLIRDLY